MFLNTKNVVILRARLRPPGRENLPAGSRPCVRASIFLFRSWLVPACSHGCIWCVVRGLGRVTRGMEFAFVPSSQCVPVRGSLRTWASVEFLVPVGGGAWGENLRAALAEGEFEQVPAEWVVILGRRKACACL